MRVVSAAVIMSSGGCVRVVGEPGDRGVDGGLGSFGLGGAMTPDCEPCVGVGTRLVLHRLAMRPDGPVDGGADGAAAGVEWVVGRVETGEFVALPPEGRRVIELLGAGFSVGEAGARVRAESGQDLDVVEFVESLVELGFVAELDGRVLAGAEPPRPTFRWLRAGHVRWMLHPVTGLAAGLVVLAAVVVVIARPGLMPGYRDLLWNNTRGVLAVLGDAALGWTIVLLHELGHLCTARAAGAPARMTLGTRLQFLVAQTDVTGVWSATRSVRLTVYLAGMVVNLVIAAAAILTRALVPEHGLVDQAAAAAAMISLLGFCAEFLLFMRTDVYFVVQDLTGAANLYAESSAYLRYLLRCLTARPRRSGTSAARPVDPSHTLPAARRRVVLAYTPVLVLGTAVCLAMAALVSVPAAMSILGHAIQTVLATLTALTTPSPTPQLGPLADAAATLLLTATMWSLWARAWWRRHAHHTRTTIHALAHATTHGFIHRFAHRHRPPPRTTHLKPDSSSRTPT